MDNISQIIAPSPPSPPLYIGKGVTGSNGTLNLFGYPIPNYLSSNFNSIVGLPPYTIRNATTDFDVSTLTEDQEVVLVLYYNNNAYITSAVYITVNWYRVRDNQCVFSYSNSFPGPSDGYYSEFGFAAWIGWLSDYYADYFGVDEIRENGQYYLLVTISGGLSYSGRADFVVRGIPAYTRLYNANGPSFDWKINLSNTFDANSYIRVGLCAQPFTNGQSTPPSDIVASVNAPSTPSENCVVTGSFDNQTPGQTYTLYGFAQASNGLYYACGVDSITLTGIPLPPSPPVVVSRIEGGLNLSWEPSKGATRYNLWYFENGDNHHYTTGTTYTLTNLTYGRQYVLFVRAQNDYGSSDWAGPTYAIVAPKTPVIIGQCSNNRITISIGNSMEGNWDFVEVCRYTASGTYIDRKDISYGNTEISWDGLTIGSTYKFKAHAYLLLDGGNMVLSVSYSNELTITVANRPNIFQWDTPKIQNQPFNIKATEWNRLIQNIKDVHIYKKGYYDSSAYRLTDVEKYWEFSHEFFNEVRFAIGSLSIPTGLADKSRGDPIIAHELDGTNSIIDILNRN